jgi:hypothetical protein
MCCFSGTVEHVADTKIFARGGIDERQAIVYEMQYQADDDLAMILPLPVPKDSKESAVQFLNLKDYPDFFEDLAKGFPRPRALAKGFAGALGGVGAGAVAKLEVVDVGDFEASFVPTVNDFSRLDERFRLPETMWTETLPRYRDWGFAVFKLKPDKRKVHPMAFVFPRRDPRKLFFPTMHIHDGTAPDKADFDHELYAQFLVGNRVNYLNWQESMQPALQFMNVKKSQGVVEAGLHVYKQSIRGQQKNRDIVI